MVLDIDEFRPEKGGNPDKIRENQKKRYCDVSMVDKIVEADEKWRKGELFYDLIIPILPWFSKEFRDFDFYTAKKSTDNFLKQVSRV